MDINLIKIGYNPPIDVNVIIEIPIGSKTIKYEIDKKSGNIFVDRFLQTPMYYPGNYGFIPHTLSKDGDPLDIIICNKDPLIVGCIINVRPIGVIIMEDESGEDEKIISVPTEKITQYYTDIKNYTDLPNIFLKNIEYFFAHYKDLEKNKWTKIKRWENKDFSYKLIEKSIARKTI